MKLYDLYKNKIVQFPDYIAKIKLRKRHISGGGIYCAVSEISKYVSTPPSSRDYPVEMSQKVEPLPEVNYRPSMGVQTYKPGDVDGKPEDPQKRTRKRKPKLEQ